MGIVRDEHCFYKDIEIRFYDCDKHKHTRLDTIMRYMADIAGIAYASKGFTHSWLWEHGFVFLLSRASIHVNRTPLADEALTMETWEREVKGVIFYRDMIFYDKDGVAVVECSTAWTLVDPVARTILKPSAFTGKIDPYTERQANCLPPARLKATGEFHTAGTRTMVYSDIDANGHVYNAVYGGIACDFLPAELMDRELSDFRINFKQEALLGEEMTVKTQVDGMFTTGNHATGNHAMVVGAVNGGVSFECEFDFR